MLRIMVYTLLDGTVCTIETDRVPQGISTTDRPGWRSIGYHKGEPIAHAEDEALKTLIADAISESHRRAGELGGWSLHVEH